MDDRTLIIIFCSINLLMWALAVDFMVRSKRHEMQIEKHNTEIEKKVQEYYHGAFQSICEMTEINIKAMDDFLNKISVKIETGENETNAEKSGE